MSDAERPVVDVTGKAVITINYAENTVTLDPVDGKRASVPLETGANAESAVSEACFTPFNSNLLIRTAKGDEALLRLCRFRTRVLEVDLDGRTLDLQSGGRPRL